MRRIFWNKQTFTLTGMVLALGVSLLSCGAISRDCNRLDASCHPELLSFFLIPRLCDLSHLEIIQSNRWPLVQAYLQEQGARGSSSAVTISLIGSSLSNYNGVALAPNGRLYSYSSTSASILEIQPSDSTASMFGSGIGFHNAAVLAPNGKIFAMPGVTVMEINL